MARILTFDPTEVLEKAMHIFWEKGVEHVSISDLVTATGVQRSGLYNVFGSKEGLFEQSFKRYIRLVVKKNFAKFFEKPDVDIRDVKKYFSNFNHLVENSASWSGCLMCNTASSNAMEAKVVDSAIAQMFSEIIGYFEKAFQISRKKKLISTPISDRELAESMLGSVIGLSNMCRSPNGRPLVKSYVSEVLRRLDSL